MSQTKKAKKMVPLESITAVMCNFARPKNARAVVQNLRKLGIKEILVWNNGAKPIPEATKNINSKKNIGPIGKYYAALQSRKDYVLIVDDDYLLNEKGLSAFRKWAPFFPAVTQFGCIFKPPFNSYRKKDKYFSHKLKSPKVVDLVIPSRGLMLKTKLYRSLTSHWAWGSLKVLSPGAFSTDLAVSCAIRDLTGSYPAVVPINGVGYLQLPEEAPEKALKNQPGVWDERTNVLKWLVANGWPLLATKEKTKKK
ncbi:MAG TPA: hypothetical protein DEB05_03910 [Firmicutes bacterium]|nr:hypothetical protein [Bacillota bacterium]